MNTIDTSDAVTYEMFGAVGDGQSDDLEAICAAHDYANQHGLTVRTRPDASYHLGGLARTAVIATDTDWNTSRFIIDDTQVEDHKTPIFEVRSLLLPVELQLDRLDRDQQHVAVYPEQDCHVLVQNDHKKLYIRRGSNQNQGISQQDCFILRQDGSIEGAIDWNYAVITKLEARPIDAQPLVLRGGIFTTFANRMKQEVGYNYWSRNIAISRSNTEVDGLTHYVVGETAVGHPYTGFIHVRQCANITLRNCFGSGHKIYSTIGAAGKPVSMGSYDYNANNVVNFRMFNCRMNHINDRTRWGIIATNLCKNILLEDCMLSRMDTHMGVSGSYVIRRTILGCYGLNAIGRGRLVVEDSKLYGKALIRLRSDYGSTWEGEVVIRNSHWTPACGDECWPSMFYTNNDGMHDFGYPCYMPREVTIDGLDVDDSHHPASYQGLYIFTDPDVMFDGTASNIPALQRPFPYRRCERVRIKRLTTASGRQAQLSTNAELTGSTTMNAAGQ